MTTPAAAAAPAVPGGSTFHRSPEEMIRAAHVILTNCGIDVRPQRVTRIVRQFEQRVSGNGFDFFTFLANAVALDLEARRRALADPDVARAIEWADPTGEQAVNNVMKTRGY